MKKGEIRRKKLMEMLTCAESPIKATDISKVFGVSRQIIVGDIAILRSMGNNIRATKYGYEVKNAIKALPYVKKIVVEHTKEQTEEELTLLVENGAFVMSVTVEHEIYGQITGDLNIGTKEEIQDFLASIEKNEQKLLLEMTGGVHTHTIACRDEDHFKEIENKLQEKGFLYF